MARPDGLTRAAGAPGRLCAVTIVRAALIALLLCTWELTAHSGLLFRDIVPSLFAIADGIARLLISRELYWHLGWTAAEVVAALVCGGLAGLATGLVLGGSRFLGRAFEHYLHYLAPTPKIIFFPVLIMWFGVGPGSKIALGAISCFFPVALSTAAAMRRIDPVLIRVGKSFRAGRSAMVRKIYLPAMRAPLINGIRLGLGISIIGTLLAETKLSNRGLGQMIIQAYATFDMPRMYGLLILLFILAIGANAVIGRFAAAAPASFSSSR